MVSAGLDYDWGDDEPPVKTLAEALAEALNIEVAEAEELTDVEPTELNSHSGEMPYGYLFDFTDRVSPALAARLMAQHGPPAARGRAVVLRRCSRAGLAQLTMALPRARRLAQPGGAGALIFPEGRPEPTLGL